MVNPPEFFLKEILSRAFRIRRITDNHNFQSLTHPNADTDFNAVWTHFLIISESLMQLRYHYPDIYSQISGAAQIIGFRRYLTHRFHDLNPQTFWENCQQPLSILTAQCRGLLNQISFQSNPTQEQNS